MDMKTTSEYMALLRSTWLRMPHKYGIDAWEIFRFGCNVASKPEDSDVDESVELQTPSGVLLRSI